MVWNIKKGNNEEKVLTILLECSRIIQQLRGYLTLAFFTGCFSFMCYGKVLTLDHFNR